MSRTVFVVALTVAVGLIATSCGTAAPPQPVTRVIVVQEPAPVAARIPPSILQVRAETLRVRGDDGPAYAVGIGVANMGTLARSRSHATNRAMGEITRQLVSMVEYMAIDFGAGAESDPGVQLEFQLEIQRTLARQTLRDPDIITEYMAADGQYWVAARLSRQEAAREIVSAANAAAALVPGANAAMWALGMMDEALGNAFGQNNEHPPVYLGD